MGTFTSLAAAIVAVQPSDPQLSWEVALADPPKGPHPELYEAHAWYGPVAVTLREEGRTLWRRPLSPRMRRAFRVNADDAAKVARAPDELWPPLPPAIVTSEVVILLDDDGVLILRRSDGGVLLDKGMDVKARHSTYFDRATWTLSADGESCSGEASHGRLLARCGSTIAFLAEGHAVFLQVNPFRTVMVRTVEQVHRPSPAGMVVHLEERGMRLTVRGITYMQ